MEPQATTMGLAAPGWKGAEHIAPPRPSGRNRRPQLHRQVRGPAPAGGGRQREAPTRNPGRENPFGGRVPAFPLDFSDPNGLHRSMEGVGALYSTYWIRFGRGGTPSTRRWRTPRRSLRQPGMRASGGSYTSRWPTPHRIPGCLTSGARGRWRRFSRAWESPTPSSGPPWSSARATCC